MSRLAVPRLLATGAVVTTSTVVRVGVRCATLAARRTPSLVQLAVASITSDRDERSESALRDELIGLFRDSAEASWLEIRRGVNDFDSFTRPEGDDPHSPRRRHRVKT